MTSSPAVAIGIDVGKDRLDVALVDATETAHDKTFANTAAGHKALVRWVGRFAADRTTAHACLEATGGYEDDAAVALHQAGLVVSVVNPRRTAAYAATQLRRSKTDRADAQLLARFCRREQPEPWTPPTDEARELRRLTRTLDALKRDRDRLRNRRGRSVGTARDALTAVLDAFAEQTAVLEAAIEAHLAAHPALAEQRDLLVSIPGVGKTTAAIVLAELGDATAFASARSVAASRRTRGWCPGTTSRARRCGASLGCRRSGARVCGVRCTSRR